VAVGEDDISVGVAVGIPLPSLSLPSPVVGGPVGLAVGKTVGEVGDKVAGEAVVGVVDGS
jgi:hypothetical protein